MLSDTLHQVITIISMTLWIFYKYMATQSKHVLTHTQSNHTLSHTHTHTHTHNRIMIHCRWRILSVQSACLESSCSGDCHPMSSWTGNSPRTYWYRQVPYLHVCMHVCVYVCMYVCKFHHSCMQTDRSDTHGLHTHTHRSIFCSRTQWSIYLCWNTFIAAITVRLCMSASDRQIIHVLFTHTHTHRSLFAVGQNGRVICAIWKQ